MLWIAAVFNLGGAALFAFPEAFAALIRLPGPVPPVDRALLATFVLLFGGAYGWMARQPVIDRPMVAFSALGKTAAFGVILSFAIAGQAPRLAVAAAAGDLTFAGLFLRWLRRTPVR